MLVENLDIWLISVSQAISPVLAKQFRRTMLHVMHVMKFDILLSFVETEIYQLVMEDQMRKEKRRLVKFGKITLRDGSGRLKNNHQMGMYWLLIQQKRLLLHRREAHPVDNSMMNNKYQTGTERGGVNQYSHKNFSRIGLIANTANV